MTFHPREVQYPALRPPSEETGERVKPAEPTGYIARAERPLIRPTSKPTQGVFPNLLMSVRRCAGSPRPRLFGPTGLGWAGIHSPDKEVMRTTEKMGMNL